MNTLVLGFLAVGAMGGPSTDERATACLTGSVGSSYQREPGSCWSDEVGCVYESATCHYDASRYDCELAPACWAGATCVPCNLDHCEVCGPDTRCELCLPGYRPGEDGGCVPGQPDLPHCVGTSSEELIELNVRVHLMRDQAWVHASGAEMTTDHISPEAVARVLLPEVNRIWAPARIRWRLESVREEQVVRTATYERDKAHVLATGRNSMGRADPSRLPALHRMMDERTRATPEDAGAGMSLFHVYLFPFIGNTSQGNAMRGFDFNTVVGVWSNKHKRHRPMQAYCAPQRRSLTEPWDAFQVGSVGQSVAHELGHVLGLRHDRCQPAGACLMQSNGYPLNDAQICTSRRVAEQRRTAK